MKIDKIVFACSAPPYVSNDDYSSFWNVQARLWQKMGIEPICLLFGQRDQTNLTDGTIIEMPVEPDLPWSLQLTWSKFCHPATEPETTWIIGDMDMLPLSRKWFTENIAALPDDAYLHLNAGGIAAPRCGDPKAFERLGYQNMGGADLPAHYHVGKGRHFAMYGPLHEKVRHIVESNRYGLGPAEGKPPPPAGESPYWHYWCAEEALSSEILWNAIQNGLDYYGLIYNNSNNQQRIDRSHWSDERHDYTYSEDLCRANVFVDMHCVRPYEKQQRAAERIFSLCGL